MCQVTPMTVGRWIEQGKLSAFHTAGGHRRVWKKDLLAFLKTLDITVPSELKDEASTRILIVDDEPAMRKYVRKALQDFCPDAEIMEGADGFEAGHAIASFLPTLIILDVKLPGLAGDRVCKLVRAEKNLEHTKILAISGLSEENNRVTMMDAGADDFLAKPFDGARLIEKVKGLLPGEGQ